MKNLVFSAIFAVLSITTVKAETQWPEYENLPPNVQTALGYKLARGGSSGEYTFFDLSIPRKAATLLKGAQLRIRDKQHRILVLAEVGLREGSDGILYARIELHQDFGSAELVIWTDVPPDLPYIGDIGGFTFTIPPQAKHP